MTQFDNARYCHKQGGLDMLAKYRRLTKAILRKTAQLAVLDDEALQAQTASFKQRLADGCRLEALLVDAYAVACEADWRVLHQRPYPEQVYGAVAMAFDNIIEMKTGEGKTLTATLPMYLHGLAGPGNFLITANDYLAVRDAAQMGVVYQFLGLTCCAGITRQGEATADKADVYASDIVYTTSSALGFDYLFDHLAATAQVQVQNGFKFALIDEVDAVLLDMAATPLVISGAPKVQSNLYHLADDFVALLTAGEDYAQSDDQRSVWFTAAGLARSEHYFGIADILDQAHADLYRHLVLALRARVLMHKDRDYVVENGELALVDVDNGRKLVGMRLRAGQHQALEAKEGLKLSPETQAMGSITYQNLFKMFDQLAGMSGTAVSDAEEFMEIYHLAVVKVPTHLPNRRIDQPDRLFITTQAKLAASMLAVQEAHALGRPVLIETGSLALSQRYSQMLFAARIPHSLLNAHSAAKEAQIIAAAGQCGAVTVATSLAGRGTDIHVDDAAIALGGLLVIGTERMSFKRVDDQLRGRAGRQGQPGASQFYSALDDRILIAHGPKAINRFVLKHHDDPRQTLSRHSRFAHVIRRTQAKVADDQRTARFTTMQYGEVFRVQRDLVYQTRQQIMTAPNLDEFVHRRLVAGAKVVLAAGHTRGELLQLLYDEVDRDFEPDELPLHPTKDWLVALMTSRLAAQRAQFAAEDQWLYFQRVVLLKAIDNAWIAQVDALDTLKTVVAGRQVAQRDVVFEYQTEARRAFAQMKLTLAHRTVQNLLCAEVLSEADGTLTINYP